MPPAAARPGRGVPAGTESTPTGEARGDLMGAQPSGLASEGAGNRRLRVPARASSAHDLINSTSGLRSLLKPGTSVPLAFTGGTAYGGTPVSLPGTVEAENFDEGGEGVAYHDLTAGNDFGSVIYRDTAVDVGPDGSLSNGYALGYTYAGEWTEYRADVAATGSYDLSL